MRRERKTRLEQRDGIDNPYSRKCKNCGVKMDGPWEMSDGFSVVFEWKCPECGNVCQRYRFELREAEELPPGVRSLEDYYNDTSYKQ